MMTFGDMLLDSLSNVNKMQQDADLAVQKLASGESQNLHETLLAVESKPPNGQNGYLEAGSMAIWGSRDVQPLGGATMAN